MTIMYYVHVCEHGFLLLEGRNLADVRTQMKQEIGSATLYTARSRRYATEYAWGRNSKACRHCRCKAKEQVGNTSTADEKQKLNRIQ